jgi:cytochrome c-type biogenesis protein CcmH
MIELTRDTVTFIGIAIGMTTFAIVFLARPWLRNSAKAGVDRSKFTVQVYRDQLAELETDMKEQRLTEEQYTQARRDLERSMIDDLGQTGPSVPLPPPQAKAHNAGLWALVMIAVSLPILALVLYGVLHISIMAVTPDEQISTTQGPSADRMARAAEDPNFSIEEMVGRLAARLEQNPNDATGWTMLGRSFTVLKRYPESRDAYAKAYQLRSAGTLTHEDAALLSDYAEAMSLSNDNQIGDEAMILLNKALRLDSNNEKALWLAGMGAFKAGEYKLAGQRWEHLYKLIPGNSEMRRSLQGAIEEAKIRSGEILITPEEETKPAAAIPAGAQGENPSTAAATTTAPTATGTQ